MSRPSRSVPYLILLAVLVSGSIVTAQAGSQRMIAAANVTVRQTPSPQAPVVAQLPLGTEVAEAGDADADKTWVRILTPDGKDGWVLANLTRPIDPFWKWQTQEALIAERLARKGDGFRALVELVSFIERIADTFTDPDARARMDLYRLKALQQALSAIPISHDKRDPYASWLNRYTTWISYSEPGGRWLVANDAIWKVHDARVNTAAADEIAWLSVTVGLGGECEGYVPCYVEWRNRLQGEYLRRYPRGAHAAEAVAAIGQTAALLNASARLPNSAYSFDAKADCKPLVESLDALKVVLGHAPSSPARQTTLENLAAIGQRCQ
jgi:hypothetical protein